MRFCQSIKQIIWESSAASQSLICYCDLGILKSFRSRKLFHCRPVAQVAQLSLEYLNSIWTNVTLTCRFKVLKDLGSAILRRNAADQWSVKHLSRPRFLFFSSISGLFLPCEPPVSIYRYTYIISKCYSAVSFWFFLK